jgi:hypothetical protein
MHPMFKELFIQTDADDLAAEQDRQRRVRQSPASPASRDHQARPQPGEPAAAVTGDPPAVPASRSAPAA